MKNYRYINLVFSVFSIALFLSSCSEKAPETSQSQAKEEIVESHEELVKRGEYLVGIMGCNDCHSPKQMGERGPEIIPELMLSGYPAERPIVEFDSKLIKEGFGMFYPDLTAAAGPWGMSFAANLTPDETGIGNWTEEQFKKAMKEGKAKGLDNGRMLLPPMPWANFIQLKDEDAHAIFTYLKNIKPVSNLVPAPIGQDNI
ncbi:MAG: diheme cytochrome c-553 [Bacteroidia bacterium]